jgi:DUF971 family protein
MAGLKPDTPVPSELRIRKQSRVIEIVYDDDHQYELSFEFLRVFTPSAEARGHAPGQETLQTGKRDVELLRIEPVGNYALRPVFSDGHDSGLYSWDLLHELCIHRDALWQTYLGQLNIAGASRDPAECPPDTPKPPPSCSSKR